MQRSSNRRETRDELFPLHSTNCADQARPSAGVDRSRRGSGSLCYLGGDRIRFRQRHVGGGVELRPAIVGVGEGYPGTFTLTRKQIEGLSTMAPQTATFTMTRKQIEGLSTMGQQTGDADPLMSMTPAQLAGIGLGTGYQLPTAQSSPTSADVLGSMSPETRRYTESIMNLTFEQLAAGACRQALAARGGRGLPLPFRVHSEPAGQHRHPLRAVGVLRVRRNPVAAPVAAPFAHSWHSGTPEPPFQAVSACLVGLEGARLDSNRRSAVAWTNRARLMTPRQGGAPSSRTRAIHDP